MKYHQGPSYTWSTMIDLIQRQYTINLSNKNFFITSNIMLRKNGYMIIMQYFEIFTIKHFTILMENNIHLSTNALKSQFTHPTITEFLDTLIMACSAAENEFF